MPEVARAAEADGSGLLVAAIGGLARPAVVGLSGFGGAGKTTLARAIARAVPGVVVVAGDDFLDRERCSRVSDDWDGLDRERLSAQLLEPFRDGAPVAWDAYDWESDSLVPRTLPPCDVLLVEGVGLLHPSLSWDLAGWLSCDPDRALAQGRARDAALGHDLAGWAVWHETDLRFVERFRPQDAADLVLPG